MPWALTPPARPSAPPPPVRRQLFWGVLGSYAILAFYFTVVLAIGRLVRGGCASTASPVPVEETPHPEEILELCEGIFIARHETYPGHLADEVLLYSCTSSCCGRKGRPRRCCASRASG